MRTLLVVLAACGGASTPPAPPSNTASTEAKPVDDAVRKWGYPTHDECVKAVDHIFTTLRKDPDGAKKLGELDNAETRKQGVDECERRWYLARIDCVHAASSFGALDTCMDAYDEPPEGIDLSAAPNRPSQQTCDGLLAHLGTFMPDLPEEWRRECVESWRPRAIACMHRAQTDTEVAACERVRD